MGNYDHLPDLRSDDRKAIDAALNRKQAEIDRLRAELAEAKADADSLRAELAEIGGDQRLSAQLANARLERDNIASLNSSLIAKLAEAKACITGLEAGQICGSCGQPWDGQGCAQKDNGHPFQTCYPVVNESPMRARAERAEDRNKHMETVLYDAQVLLGTEDIGELITGPTGPISRLIARAECAEAEIAEAMDRLCYTAGECDLVTACEHWVANFHEANVRAERAEAGLKIMWELLDWIYGFLAYVDSYHSRIIRDKVSAALAPSPAGEKP